MDETVLTRQGRKVLLTHKGETHNLREWAKIKGIPEATLNSRIHSDKLQYALLTHEEIQQLELTVKNKTNSLIEWSEITGIPYRTILDRYYKRWDPEDIITAEHRTGSRIIKPRTALEHVEEADPRPPILRTIEARLAQNWTIQDILDKYKFDSSVTEGLKIVESTTEKYTHDTNQLSTAA